MQKNVKVVTKLKKLAAGVQKAREIIKKEKSFTSRRLRYRNTIHKLTNQQANWQLDRYLDERNVKTAVSESNRQRTVQNNFNSRYKHLIMFLNI